MYGQTVAQRSWTSASVADGLRATVGRETSCIVTITIPQPAKKQWEVIEFVFTTAATDADLMTRDGLFAFTGHGGRARLYLWVKL